LDKCWICASQNGIPLDQVVLSSIYNMLLNENVIDIELQDDASLFVGVSANQMVQF
jgi:hypothetical protein